jgi:1-phosphofructokinase family hexose kinase
VITCLALSVSLDITYLVGHYELGGIHRPLETLKLAGGKALNVARAARALGAETRVIGIIGGPTGERVRSLLGSIPATLISDTAETRSCVSVADVSRGALTEIYEYASPIAAPAWSEFEAGVGALDPTPGEWVVLSGSIPDGVPVDRLADLLRRCSAAGAKIAIDTHGPALAAVLGLADLVKVNRAEAAELLAGANAGLEELTMGIRSLTRSGATVVVTDGVRGALAAVHSIPGARDEEIFIAGDPEVGQFPVGSGDSYLAALLVALDSGVTVRNALIDAAACASANAKRPGAAIFDAAEVDRARSRIAAATLG